MARAYKLETCAESTPVTAWSSLCRRDGELRVRRRDRRAIGQDPPVKPYKLGSRSAPLLAKGEAGRQFGRNSGAKNSQPFGDTGTSLKLDCLTRQGTTRP